MSPLSDVARTRLRIAAVATTMLIVVTSPWWGRLLASQLSFFRVRRVEIVGVRYLAPNDILARLRVDTTRSVWDDPIPLEQRVAAHPQVGSVSIRRKLPGTLVVSVVENMPVAMVSTEQGFLVFDERGRQLPLDPSQVPVNLPIAARRDTALFGLLARVRAERPRIFARLSDVSRTGDREVLLHFESLPVRAMLDVTPERLAEIFPVEADLAKRQARVAELDLRFRDQVIARLQ
ncbi:MAG TPA: FtsQ-type POTRA domain-containing protein [Gemmatimonadaceae bacterium]|nr:FtsQ-type POTRA domain-containing protein [Gemmatimonadaceae bacterium]